jgi:glycosyltransferase involved in cell wall biosynthesis
MWTKNGAQTLPAVLARIAAVIPDTAVNQRLIVDDQSSDNTPQIAQSYGWAVIPNEGKGISDGANIALRHVETDTFISFEQDLLLARGWWQKIPRYLSDSKTAIASGVRFVYYPPVLKKLQEYTAAGYKSHDQEGKFFPYVKTLDNTIYKTDILRRLGGFPKLPFSAGVDHVLAHMFTRRGIGGKSTTTCIQFICGRVWRMSWRITTGTVPVPTNLKPPSNAAPSKPAGSCNASCLLLCAACRLP